MSLPPSDLKARYGRVVHAVRLELEAAGNPSYTVVVVEESGAIHTSPMVFASAGPAQDHATLLAGELPDSDTLLIVCRAAGRSRQTFDILDPAAMRKVHTQLEVIETSFVQSNTL